MSVRLTIDFGDNPRIAPFKVDTVKPDSKDIRWTKPQVQRMLGEDLVFFRGKHGEMKALNEACPHRGAYLSLGDFL